MKFNSTDLINTLISETNVNIERVQILSQLSIEALNQKENKEKWSALECIEHLNLYGDYYFPEIKKSISNTTHPIDTIFKSGIIGNYFAKSMAPKTKLNKMKSPADKNPINSDLDLSVIDRFNKQQKELLNLLELARTINLTKTKTPISITTILKLRLGDTFRFVSAHNNRHILQAESVIRNLKG